MKITSGLSLNRWVWMNAAGWFTGVILVIILELIGETIGWLDDDRARQVIVGTGMGTGVGWLQWIALRKPFGIPIQWLWYSVFGFTAAYLLFDLFAYIVGSNYQLDFVLPFASFAGAWLTGFLQHSLILKKRSNGFAGWPARLSVAWLTAHAAAMSTIAPTDIHPSFSGHGYSSILQGSSC